ncbi:MAG: YhfC family intramembrane metalloprotease, partial [Anaerolineae bacterium]|nr:YhfC family intramembrane metalloprotease [Anaerolineae bacterium]
MMLVFTHALNPALMILIPLVVAILLVRRWRLDWAVFGLGAFTFVLSQVFHLPFNQWL